MVNERVTNPLALKSKYIVQKITWSRSNKYFGSTVQKVFLVFPILNASTDPMSQTRRQLHQMLIIGGDGYLLHWGNYCCIETICMSLDGTTSQVVQGSVYYNLNNSLVLCSCLTECGPKLQA